MPEGFSDEFVGWVDFSTALAPTPDGRILITQQTGQVLVYQNGSIGSSPAVDLSSRVCTNIERGLTGVAVDPAFADSHWIYLFYTYDRGTDSAVPTRRPSLAARQSRFAVSSR